MAGWEQELPDVLEEETRLLRRLADLAQQKYKPLRLGDVARVDDFTGREHAVAEALALREERRRQILTQAGLADRPLRELAAMAEGGAGGRLRAAFSAMTAASAALRAASRRNWELIRTRLEWNGRLLRVMAPERQMYDSRGGASRSGLPTGLVDRRV